jgi:hypothetical protein
MLTERVHRVRARMEVVGIDVLLLWTGADLPWLTGTPASRGDEFRARRRSKGDRRTHRRSM